jgi:hypothetical protein
MICWVRRLSPLISAPGVAVMLEAVEDQVDGEVEAVVAGS